MMLPEPLKITELWAVVLDAPGIPERPEGFEGIVLLPDGTPLVAADLKRIEELMPLARALAKAAGQRLRVLHFHGRQVVAEIEP